MSICDHLAHKYSIYHIEWRESKRSCSEHWSSGPHRILQWLYCITLQLGVIYLSCRVNAWNIKSYWYIIGRFINKGTYSFKDSTHTIAVIQNLAGSWDFFFQPTEGGKKHMLLIVAVFVCLFFICLFINIIAYRWSLKTLSEVCLWIWSHEFSFCDIAHIRDD